MRHIKFTLITIATILATGLSSVDRASAQATPGSIDIFGLGATIINGLINPPSRPAEILADTELKKAKIAAETEIAKEKMRLEATKNTDRVTPVLNQWGVARVACAQGLVFINGITTDTVCIQPSTAMASGYYTYDSAKQRLIRDNSGGQNNATAPTNTERPIVSGQSIGGQTSNSVQTSTNGQSSSVRTITNGQNSTSVHTSTSDRDGANIRTVQTTGTRESNLINHRTDRGF
jgi:hypothetical protein